MDAFRGYTHVISSVAIYMFIIKRINVEISPLPMLAFIVLGSLLPDIDYVHSLIGRYFVPINLFMKHRGITHSILGMLLFTLPLMIYSKIAFIGVLYGYFMHLLLDSFTPTGIKYLQPFSDYRVSFNICKTSIAELAIFCLSLQYILLR